MGRRDRRLRRIQLSLRHLSAGINMGLLVNAAHALDVTDV